MVPGLFQTLDTLEKAMLPLFDAHPELTLLLVAPPGLPNTHWPANVSLDGKVWLSTVFFPSPGRVWLCWMVLLSYEFSLSTPTSQSQGLQIKLQE